MANLDGEVISLANLVTQLVTCNNLSVASPNDKLLFYIISNQANYLF